MVDTEFISQKAIDIGSRSTFYDYMVRVIFFLAVYLVCGNLLFAQQDSSSAEPVVNPDSIIQAGMDEVLSYLLLTREDFTFRDDYTEKDAYRLAIVDSLMNQPLLMDLFADSFRVVLEDIEDCPGCLMELMGRLRGGEAGLVTEGAVINDGENRSFRKVDKVIRTHVEALAGLLADRHLFGAIDVFDTSSFLDIAIGKYRQVILEDENYKEQTAEEMDSVQHLEEEYVLEFKELAAEFPDIAFIDIAPIIQRIDTLRILFETNSKLREKREAGEKVSEFRTDAGNVAVGTFGNDLYRGDYFMIFDPGGDDSYYIEYDINNPHPTLIADYGGNDFYRAESEFALGAGAFSYSFLIDYEGDDIYRGGNFSLGCGYFGVGILWDKKGNDSYFGDTFTQGAGTFGLGLLIDSEGSDNYTGNLFCQGFGFVRGFGGLVDYSGNDTYAVQGKYPESFHVGSHFQSLSQGFAIGLSPYLSGGFGFLYDFDGNDAYIADYFCQGASYWWSLGILYDDAGDDKYLSYQYAQGNGTHLTLGYLRDNHGDDVYRSHGVCQGCGHDYACGWLNDREGDDVYSAYDLAQGAGQANGIGIFTDGLGRDGYYVFLKSNTQGYGNPRRDYGSIGVFLDGNGDDRYDGNGANDFFWRTDSKWGGGLDKQSIPEDSPEKHR